MFRIGQNEPAPAEDPQEAPETPPEQDEAASDPAEMTSEESAVGPNQVDQSLVAYMGEEYGPFRCDHCRHWQGPASCNIVTGTIEPGGCCNIYEPANKSGDMESEAPEMETAPEEAPVEAPPEESAY